MKNIVRIIIGVCVWAAMGLTACQQEEDEMGIYAKHESITRGDAPLRCIITTLAEGKVDSLINDWVKKGYGARDAISYLEVSGPINGSDLSVMCQFQYLDSLVLTHAEKETITESQLSLNSKAAVMLPLSLKTIGRNTFRGGKVLSVYIPDNVTSIGYSAFHDCSNLQEVRLPKNIVRLENSLFQGCTNLKEIDIPANVAAFGVSVFVGCTSLKHVTLPSNLRTSGAYIFQNCTNLESVTWSPNLTYIPDYTFKNCAKLKFVIPDYITSIGREAFHGCKSLTELKLPVSVKSVGYGAFWDCGITSLSIGPDFPMTGDWIFQANPISSLVIEEGITALAGGIFANCTELKNVKLPSSLKKIGDYAFRDCTGLKQIEWSEGLESMGEGALQNCAQLEQVVLPSSVKSFGRLAFRDCKKLTSVTLPEGLESIGNQAFYNSGITSLTVPSTVKSSGYGLVSECDHITHIYWKTPIEAPDLIQDNERNLLVYLSHGKSHENNSNRIVNGRAQAPIRLKSAGDYSCPEAFTAAKVTYTREFNDFGYQSSGFGNAAGWQTIVLPFTVTSIQAEDGRILAPFGADVPDAKPFWLRELTPNGFVKATKIEANKPYIIAMPNNSKYLPEYNVYGDVTFVAENVTIPATEPLNKVEGAAFDFYPSYLYLEKSADRLTINKGEYYDSSTGKSYPEGSVFIGTKYEVQTFEAYVQHHVAGTRGLIEINPSSKTRAAREVGPVPMEDDM